MPLSDILEKAKKLATPSETEQACVNKIASEVVDRTTKEIKRQKLAAKVKVGGSVAKGTWLPGLSDIDFFIIFDYKKFSKKSDELSDFAEKVLKKLFRITRIKGSRDYFSTKYKKYNLEFVPVLDISKNRRALNVTDFSPLHVRYIIRKAKNKDEIRIAKQFCKAAGVYGAESYIQGLSGHVIDILVANFGTFVSFLKAVAKWPDKVVLDPERHYKSKKEVLEKLNPSKTVGPLVLVDPIEPDRNSAAALGKEKFGILRKTAKKFLRKPNLNFFKEKFVTIAELRAKKKNLELVAFESGLGRGKPDVIGSKKKAVFEKLQRRFISENFPPVKAGWQLRKNALFWFYFKPVLLSRTKLHMGPPVRLEKYAEGFKKAWKGRKILIKNGRYAVEVRRKYTSVKRLAKDLAKEFKLKLFYYK